MGHGTQSKNVIQCQKVQGPQPSGNAILTLQHSTDIFLDVSMWNLILVLQDKFANAESICHIYKK